MTFLQRNKLIEALVSRGFVAGVLINVPGWVYRHPDGFTLDFNAAGNFTLRLDGDVKHIGVATEPAHILDLIDREAAAL